MSITSKPSNKDYRDNFSKTFNKDKDCGGCGGCTCPKPQEQPKPEKEKGGKK